MGEIKELLKELSENIAEALKSKSDIIFPDGSVPIKVATRIYGKNASWVHAGLIAGWLPIGFATRDGKRITDVKDMDSKLGKINYFISPKLLYEHTGYMWGGEKE